jgi:hypothetical protein
MNKLAVRQSDQETKLAAIRTQIANATGQIERVVAIAQGLRMCREIVNQNLPVFKELAGSQLGFAIDRPDKTTDAQYVDAISQALLEGDSITGNHFAIIGGRYYRQVGGWEAKWARIADEAPEVRLGTIEITQQPGWADGKGVPGMARVEAEGSVSVNGELYEVAYRDCRAIGEHGMDQRLVIRVNNNMGEDAILGKARARILKALWRIYSGERAPSATEDDGPAGESVTITVEPRTAAAEESPPAIEAGPSKLERFTEAVKSAQDTTALLAVTAPFTWTDSDGEDRAKARELYAAKKKALGAK